MRWKLKVVIGKDYIEQYGGAGNNLMHVTGGASDDVIEMYGGPRNNTMIYDVSPATTW